MRRSAASARLKAAPAARRSSGPRHRRARPPGASRARQPGRIRSPRRSRRDARGEAARGESTRPSRRGRGPSASVWRARRRSRQPRSHCMAVRGREKDFSSSTTRPAYRNRPDRRGSPTHPSAPWVVTQFAGASPERPPENRRAGPRLAPGGLGRHTGRYPGLFTNGALPSPRPSPSPREREPFRFPRPRRGRGSRVRGGPGRVEHIREQVGLADPRRRPSAGLR